MNSPKDRDFDREIVQASRGVLPETTALAAIGCADLMYTMFLIGTNQARETNPLMNEILLSTGPYGFVLAKAILIGVPLAIAEYARRQREQFVRAALRVGILLYISFYALLWLRYNT